MESDDAPVAHFTDEEIRAVVDHYDDPDHPDALDLREVRTLLSDLQASVSGSSSTYTAAIRSGELGVVADTRGTFVLGDSERRRWKRLLDDVGCYDSVDRTMARVTHHQAAGRLTDREFNGTDPVVVGKPSDAEAGQRFVEAVGGPCCRPGSTPGKPGPTTASRFAATRTGSPWSTTSSARQARRVATREIRSRHY